MWNVWNFTSGMQCVAEVKSLIDSQLLIVHYYYYIIIIFYYYISLFCFVY